MECTIDHTADDSQNSRQIWSRSARTRKGGGRELEKAFMVLSKREILIANIILSVPLVVYYIIKRLIPP